MKRTGHRLALRAFCCALLAWATAGLWLTGCAPETRYRILSRVVDGVPEPGKTRPPRRRRVHRARAEPVRATEVAAVLPIEPVSPPRLEPTFDSYAELEALFPRDTMGNVDWAAAARGRLIRPRPGIDADTPDIPPMPLDVRLDPGLPGFEVVFPHEAHTYWLRCDNCHPAIFQMKAGADPITMAAIFAGEYCGRCHGKVAFPPASGCPRCHPAMGKAR